MGTTDYKMGTGKVTVIFTDGCVLKMDAANATISMNPENLHNDAIITLVSGSFTIRTPHQVTKWNKEEGVVYKHWTDE